MLTGDQLVAARTLAGMTQQQLANRIGVSMRSVGNWERAERVPRGAEVKVREALHPHLGSAASTAAVSPAVDLTTISDARLLAEIARRFDRAREEGEHGDSTAPTTLAERRSAPTEVDLANARDTGRRESRHAAVAEALGSRPADRTVYEHPALVAAYEQGWSSLTDADLREAVKVAKVAGDDAVDEADALHRLRAARATTNAAPPVPDDIAASDNHRDHGRAQAERDRQDEEGEA